MSVLSYLQDLASNLVLLPDELASISTSITTLQTRLESYFGSQVEDHFQFGSSTRGTILPRKADENSDIDYMVAFDNSDQLKPQTFLNRLRRFVEYRYSRSQIYQSHPTIVLELNHIKFELVPAYRDFWGNLYIPSSASDFAGWIQTDPNSFNNALTNANMNNNYQIKPLIRLMKYWNAQYPRCFASYSFEQDLVNQYYSLCNNLKDYLFYAITNLMTDWYTPQYKRKKIERAKQIIEQVKAYENCGMPYSAENEIKKLLPELT